MSWDELGGNLTDRKGLDGRPGASKKVETLLER